MHLSCFTRTGCPCFKLSLNDVWRFL